MERHKRDLHVVRGIMLNEHGEFLVGRRSAQAKRNRNLVEFVGGQVDGRPDARALKDEISHEVNLVMRQIGQQVFNTFRRPFDDDLHRLHITRFYPCSSQGTLALVDKELSEVAWLPMAELLRVADFTPASYDTVQRLAQTSLARLAITPTAA